jgi:glycosyltransferase involved in cell wall biosynthesis
MVSKIKSVFYRACARFLNRILRFTESHGRIEQLKLDLGKMALNSTKGFGKVYEHFDKVYKHHLDQEGGEEAHRAALLDIIRRLEVQTASVNLNLTDHLRVQEAQTAALLDVTKQIEVKMVSANIHARLGAVTRDHKKSVVFIENSYYHFYYLARALRRRGWDAQVVSFSDPDGQWANYYHGYDLNLYHPDPQVDAIQRVAFFEAALPRFKLVHFCSDFVLSFSPPYFRNPDPPDLKKWISHGNFVACSIAGCNSCNSKATVRKWSLLGGKSVCSCCPWDDRQDICAPDFTLMNGQRAIKYCSFIAGEMNPALDYLNHPKAIMEPPFTFCLDTELWHPELTVPDDFKIQRSAEEVLVYHGVGEYNMRTKNNINIKGTHAIMEAVDRLKAEGHPVRLIFATGIRNLDVRYLQSQCDIIVDQLNYGRYGSQAREGMMLGKSVICYINMHEIEGATPLRILEDCPIQSASENTVYDVLRGLVSDRSKREVIGRMSRSFALKWHSPEGCAERYEKVYDAMIAGEWDMRGLFKDIS